MPKPTIPLLAAAAFAGMATASHAGGLERGGYSVDLLFDPSRFAAEASSTWVAPQRKLDNVVDTDPSDGTPAGPSSGVRSTASYFVPRIGFKAAIGEDVDCMGDYSQPWGAHKNPGLYWAGANHEVETKIYSHALSATCSYRFDAGPGHLRVLGGVTWQEVGGFQERLVAVLPPSFGSGLGRIDIKGDGWGWRAGAAYEIPEIAFRASLVYHSSVKLGNLSGDLDLRQVPSAVDPSNPLLGTVTPVFGSASMPASAEFKLQSGIAPGWLAFGSVKWTDWSTLQSIAFCPEATRGFPCTATGPTKTSSLDLLYRDGWTLTAGIGHAFTKEWSGAVSLSWDRGTSTGIGTQTDTWLATAGVSYAPHENFEFRFGGAAGILTGGSSGEVIRDGITYGDDVSYSFGNDFVGALNVSLKVRF